MYTSSVTQIPFLDLISFNWSIYLILYCKHSFTINRVLPMYHFYLSAFISFRIASLHLGISVFIGKKGCIYMIKEKEYTRVHKTYTTNTIGKATQERTQKTTLFLSGLYMILLYIFFYLYSCPLLPHKKAFLLPCWSAFVHFGRILILCYISKYQWIKLVSKENKV